MDYAPRALWEAESEGEFPGEVLGEAPAITHFGASVARHIHKFSFPGNNRPGNETGTPALLMRLLMDTSKQLRVLKGSKVLWLEGMHPTCEKLKSVLSVDSPALQVCWVWFQASEEKKERSGVEEGEQSKKKRCMCIRESTCLTLFMSSGAVHSIPLPFLVIMTSVLKVHVMKKGLRARDRHN